MQSLSAPWRTSSYSTNGGQNCVEAATAVGHVLIRDTTNRDGEPLVFPPAAWTAFATSLK